MNISTDSQRTVHVNWSWGIRPLRLLVTAVAVVLLAFAHGMGLAVRETLRTGALGVMGALREAGRGQLLHALWTLIGGLLQMVAALPSPFFANFVVGMGAAVELCRQALTDDDQHFEIVLGGTTGMAFLARRGDLFTRAEVVSVSEHRFYPVIESVEVVSSSFLAVDDVQPTLLDTTPYTLPMPFVGGMVRQTEGTPASFVDGLRRYADC